MNTEFDLVYYNTLRVEYTEDALTGRKSVVGIFAPWPTFSRCDAIGNVVITGSDSYTGDTTLLDQIFSRLFASNWVTLSYTDADGNTAATTVPIYVTEP